MDHVFSLAHDSWEKVLQPFHGEIATVLQKIALDDIAPQRSEIFAALNMQVSDVKCVIIGQDPYPTPGNAHGLAFSVAGRSSKIPASLRNIFLELSNDIDMPIPTTGDLTQWKDQGVLLLNRVLTTKVGQSNAHSDIGWEEITEHICTYIGSLGVPAILWGKSAQKLSSCFSFSVSSVHPSPLSAYRGFFGSKPFSQINHHLSKIGIEPIDWSLN